MPYVERDEQGNIIGFNKWKEPGVVNPFLPADHPDVVAHLNPVPTEADIKSTIESEAERRCTLIVPHQSKRVLKLRGNPNDPDLAAMQTLWDKADVLIASVAGMTEQQRIDFDATDDIHWL